MVMKKLFIIILLCLGCVPVIVRLVYDYLPEDVYLPISATDLLFYFVGPCPQRLKFRHEVSESIRHVIDMLQEDETDGSVDNVVSKLDSLISFVDSRKTLEEEEYSISMPSSRNRSLTVIINAHNNNNGPANLTIVSRLVSSFANVPHVRRVLVAVPEHVASSAGDDGMLLDVIVSSSETVAVKVVPAALSSSPAQVWNDLVADVTTPFTLVARDMLDTLESAPNYETLLLDVVERGFVAGGSTRNATGHWRVTCAQSTARNFAMRFVDGYDEATWQGCLMCDYVDGPFVASTHVLRNVSFDARFSSERVLFHDWFWRVKEEAVRVLSCPQVIFDIREGNTPTKEQWLPFARKYELTLLYVESRLHRFSCEDVQFNCQTKKVTRGHLLSPCCVQKATKAMIAMHDFVLMKHNCTYEVDAGLVVGGVKGRGFLPWDLDGDATVSQSMYWLFKNEFEYSGLTLGGWVAPVDAKGGYVKIFSGPFFLEVWMDDRQSYVRLPPEYRNVSTKTQFGNKWLNTHANPGLYSRSKYAYDILKHSQSWRAHGLSSSFADYIAGRWLPCGTPKRHTCLDNYLPDGNIQFLVPNFV